MKEEEEEEKVNISVGWNPHVGRQMNISAGIDYFNNNNSKIIIKKYLISLKANTLGTFGSSVEMGG